MLTLKVPDMTCGHCAGMVTKAVKSVDSEAEINVDLATQTVTIDAKSEDAAFVEALQTAGYPTDLRADR